MLKMGVFFVEVFCEQVANVVPTCHLEELDIAHADAILKPQVGYGEVAYSSKSPPSAYADSSRCIGANLQSCFMAKLGQQAFASEALGCTADNTAQLSFCSAESNRALRR